MGDFFTVVNKATTGTIDGTQKFNVNFNKNLTITNYKPSEGRAPQKGDLTAKFCSDKKDISIVSSDGKTLNRRRTVDLSSTKYTIFQELVKLDGNGKDLTEKDLFNAKILIGKHGVTAVRRDAEAGVTSIVMKDGGILRFDFETDAEKQARFKKYDID